MAVDVEDVAVDVEDVAVDVEDVEDVEDVAVDVEDVVRAIALANSMSTRIGGAGGFAGRLQTQLEQTTEYSEYSASSSQSADSTALSDASITIVAKALEAELGAPGSFRDQLKAFLDRGNNGLKKPPFTQEASELIAILDKIIDAETPKHSIESNLG